MLKWQFQCALKFLKFNKFLALNEKTVQIFRILINYSISSGNFVAFELIFVLFWSQRKGTENHQISLQGYLKGVHLSIPNVIPVVQYEFQVARHHNAVISRNSEWSVLTPLRPPTADAGKIYFKNGCRRCLGKKKGVAPKPCFVICLYWRRPLHRDCEIRGKLNKELNILRV